MKRKSASLLGNVPHGVRVGGDGCGGRLLHSEPSFRSNLPQFFAHGAILSIFVGAVLWLAGARIGEPRAGQRPLLVGAPL